MAAIGPAEHPALDLGALLRLRPLESLDDAAMVNEVRRALFDARSRNPSIETLVHAFLPATYIDHTHADAILTLTNQRDGLAILRDAFWDSAVVVPYVEPGFLLAKAAAAAAASNPSARALVLMKHGLVTWGATARESYTLHLDLVTQAEKIAEARARRGATVTVTTDAVSTCPGPPCRDWPRPARAARAPDRRRGPGVGPGRAAADCQRRRARVARSRGREGGAGHAAAHRRPSHPDPEPAAVDRGTGVGRRHGPPGAIRRGDRRVSGGLPRVCRAPPRRDVRGARRVRSLAARGARARPRRHLRRTGTPTKRPLPGTSRLRRST